jgi:hypothetical protein
MLFYVYRHIRLDSSTPFYVGKGSLKRSRARWGRNSRWDRIVGKVGFRVEVVASFELEADAYTFEEKLIKTYKTFGYCEANFSSGGNGGFSGVRRPEEFRKMIGACTKARLSKGHHLSKPLICNETGVIYRDSAHASREMGLHQGHINKVCNGIRKSHGGYTFSFAKVG